MFRRLTSYVSCYDAGLVELSAVRRNTFAELKEEGQASLTDAEETTTGTVLWRIAGTRLRSKVEDYKGTSTHAKSRSERTTGGATAEGRNSICRWS